MTYIRPLYTMAVFVQQTWPCLEHARSCRCLGGSSWPFLWLSLVECRSATATCIAHHCEELKNQVNILNFHKKSLTDAFLQERSQTSQCYIPSISIGNNCLINLFSFYQKINSKLSFKIIMIITSFLTSYDIKFLMKQSTN